MRIITHPDPVLRQRCDDTVVDTAARALVMAMAEQMYASAGIGLAAPQVGVTKRVIVADPTGGEAGQLVAMINPIIIWASPEVELGEEGCLSLPGVQVQIPRHRAIQVSYVDVDDRRRSQLLDSTWSRVVQHEMDHLDGITLLDRISPLARRFALRDLQGAR